LTEVCFQNCGDISNDIVDAFDLGLFQDFLALFMDTSTNKEIDVQMDKHMATFHGLHVLDHEDILFEDLVYIRDSDHHKFLGKIKPRGYPIIFQKTESNFLRHIEFILTLIRAKAMPVLSSLPGRPTGSLLLTPAHHKEDAHPYFIIETIHFISDKHSHFYL
jgi:hypothetical protein